MSEQTPRLFASDHPVNAAARAIDGTGLKLRFRRDGTGFAITERLAPLGSVIDWWQEKELAIIALRRSGGQWRIQHYDGRAWSPDLVVDEDDIECQLRMILHRRPTCARCGVADSAENGVGITLCRRCKASDPNQAGSES